MSHFYFCGFVFFLIFVQLTHSYRPRSFKKYKASVISYIEDKTTSNIFFNDKITKSLVMQRNFNDSKSRSAFDVDGNDVLYEITQTGERVDSCVIHHDVEFSSTDIVDKVAQMVADIYQKNIYCPKECTFKKQNCTSWEVEYFDDSYYYTTFDEEKPVCMYIDGKLGMVFDVFEFGDDCFDDDEIFKLPVDPKTDCSEKK